MKTILFVSPTGTLDNGAEISIVNFMRFLVEENYRVINVAPQYHHPAQIEYYDTCKEYGIKTHFIPAMKWWWEDAPGGLSGSKSERAMYYRENINTIRNLIQEYQVDIVITNTVNMFQGAVASACEGKKHLWLIHEFPENEFSYYKNKIDFISDYSDEIYAVKGELNRKLNAIFNERMIKSFVPYTEIKSTQLKVGQKQRIVSVGRLTKRKNQLELIAAYRNLNLPDLELILIGGWDEEYKRECVAYVNKHKLKNITFAGNLKNPWEKVTDKDICVLPSSMETFGLVYVEALLNGIPVILSDNPGHLSAYEIFEFGTLYSSGNNVQLSTAISAILDNFKLEKTNSEQYVANAKEKYQIRNVYHEIIKDIDSDELTCLKSVRHLENLLSINEPKSRLVKLEWEAKRLTQKVRKRLFKK